MINELRKLKSRDFFFFDQNQKDTMENLGLPKNIRENQGIHRKQRPSGVADKFIEWLNQHTLVL